MNAYSVIIRDYEDILRFWRRKNKANLEVRDAVERLEFPLQT